MKKIILKIFHFTLCPVHYSVEFFHRRVISLNPRHRKMAHIFVGGGIAYVGIIIMSTVKVAHESVFHLVPEFCGGTIHAIGITPIIEEIFKHSESKIDYIKLKKEIIEELSHGMNNHVEEEINDSNQI